MGYVLWYSGSNAASNAVSYAKFYSRADCVIIRMFNETGEFSETQKSSGDFRAFGAEDSGLSESG